MKLRTILAAASCLVMPVLAHAQPVTGPYVGLGAGTSILNPTSFNYEAANGELSGKTFFHPDYAGVVSVGYGFGNGFRVQLDGDYIKNTAASSGFNFFDDDEDQDENTLKFKSTGAEEKY